MARRVDGQQTLDKTLAEKKNCGRCRPVRVRRAYFRQPDPVARLKLGGHLLRATKRTWYGGGAEGYTDYPLLQPNHY
jgi:N-ethylmaleimide reductase